MNCIDIAKPIYFIFSKDVPSLLYYSHVPVIIASLLLAIFVYTKSKSQLSKLLLGISLTFSAWVFLSLVTWTNIDSSVISFSWSLFPLLTPLVAIFVMYFIHYFLFEKIPVVLNFLSLLVLLPIIFFLPTEYNIDLFDLSICEPHNPLFLVTYYHLVGWIAMVYIFIVSVIKIKSKPDKIDKKEVYIMMIGSEFFLLLFNSLGYLASYFDNYTIEFFGLYGMILFLSFLSYNIVKYKAFDIKLIGAQALVWALVILIGSQFFFIQSNTNKILTGITLIISAIVGLIIVRGVKKEISQREKIERLAKDLEFSNKGQENLIHIMNHQIKGFLGITRNIFAELLQSDDYGKMPEEAKPLLTKGLETTSSGVNYVQEILRGSNAEKGTLAYDMKPLNIKELVTTLCAEQKDIAVKKDLSFETELTEGDFNTIGDTTHLIEAFKNLITNAIKYNDYSDPNRGIKVILTEKGDKIIYSVRDTGIGIAEEDKPRLFTAGGMGKDSTKYNVESSGFGLAYVKGVAEAHKGRVGFKSNAPEKGTTFYMELPKKS